MLSSEMMRRLREQEAYYRHYVDEEQAYDPKMYRRLIRLTSAFHTMLRYNENFDDDYAENFIRLAADAESRLIERKDPKTLRIPIWGEGIIPDRMRGREGYESADPADFKPFIIPSLIDDGERHPAIIVIAGGMRSTTENYEYCKFFNSIGMQAFQLGNRVELGHTGAAVPNAALDLQRAIRFIRYHADEYQVDPEHIFAVGSSLGGVTIVQYIEDTVHDKTPDDMDAAYTHDEIDLADDSICGMIGIYTSSYPFSKRPEGVNYAAYPLVFAALGGRDWAFKYQMMFFNELVQNDVKVEIHVFDGAVHGFGLGDNVIAPTGIGEKIESVAFWPELARLWVARVIDGKAGMTAAREKVTPDSALMKDCLEPSWPGYPGD